MFVYSIFYVKLLTLKVIISFVCLLGSLKDLFKSFIRSFVIFSIEYIFSCSLACLFRFRGDFRLTKVKICSQFSAFFLVSHFTFTKIKP